ncbi:MAG: hypothetical protein AB7N71_08905 [Phycisphaerae bacterium]
MIRDRIATVLLSALLIPHAAVGQSYEAHYVYLGGYPIAETAWSHEIHGVAHDDDHWYITQAAPVVNPFKAIWKIPVGLDLRTVTESSPGVLRRMVSSVPQLSQFKFIGDPDVYRHNGIDYLVVPISEEGSCFQAAGSGVAFFRCSDLSYIDHASLPGQCGEAEWVAVDSAGQLYSSRDFIAPNSGNENQRGLRVYNVDWNTLQLSQQATITFDHTVLLFDVNGAPLGIRTMQGGEFAPGDQLLYLSSGYALDNNDDADRGGLHVFDTATFRRVQHSSRGVNGQIFDFYYDPGFDTFEEPQGLTLWDLDDGRAPGIRGQLHAIVREDDELHDDVDFKHYTRALSVDSNWTGCQTGAPACPFSSIPAALSAAWDGAEIRMRSGSYPNPLTVSRRLRFSAENGIARICG